MSWTGNLTAIINNVDLFEGEDGALEAIYTAGATLSISIGRPIDKNGMMSWLFTVIPDGKATKGFWGDSIICSFGGVGGLMHPVTNGTISRVLEGVEVQQQQHDIHTHVQSDGWTHTHTWTQRIQPANIQYIRSYTHTDTMLRQMLLV